MTHDLTTLKKEAREEMIAETAHQIELGELGGGLYDIDLLPMLDTLIEKAFHAGIETARGVMPETFGWDGTARRSDMEGDSACEVGHDCSIREWNENIDALLADSLKD
jgi:hypothetical protein